jgi:uncharacterized membrane-anchored protein YhcB (DUF1043 family)
VALAFSLLADIWLIALAVLVLGVILYYVDESLLNRKRRH